MGNGGSRGNEGISGAGKATLGGSDTLKLVPTPTHAHSVQGQYLYSPVDLMQL